MSLKFDIFKLAKKHFGWKMEAHVTIFRLFSFGYIL